MKCDCCHSDVSASAAFCPRCGARRPNVPEPDDYRYAAFISYRHVPHDQEVAIQVQRAIETYRLPKGLAAPGALGGRAIGKCFRDEDELAAAHSLPERIKKALAQSRTLVVICSPEAADSEWVNREIQAFAELHGRERIYAVLASGDSASSIPAPLKGVARESADASLRPASNNPLAADLRPAAVHKQRAELLRILAAVAGCGYDDLAQREQTRRRKQIVLALAVAAVIIALVAGIAAIAANAHQDSLVQESRRLAQESTQLLVKGDRYGAIQTALAALPASSTSTDRPLVPEAQDALANALQVYPNDKSSWRASYKIATQDTLGYIGSAITHREGADDELRASALAVSDSGSFFAISDDGGNVATYDLLTGKKLADCAMPQECEPLDGGLYVRMLAATENYLLVSHGGQPSAIVCFDARTGEQAWSLFDTGAAVFDTSYGADYASMVSPLASGGYSAAITDLAESASSVAENTGTGILPTSTAFFTTSGSQLGTNYAAFGNQLFKLELGTGASGQVQLAYPAATSLEFVGGKVIAASAEPMPDDAIDRRFAIQAFDENLNPQWRYDGVFASEMIVEGGYTTLLAGEPAIRERATVEGGVVVNAGRSALVLDAATGNAVFQLSFDQTVVEASVISGPTDDSDLIYTACANGTITSKDRTGATGDTEGDSRRLALPFPIRWAHIAECGNNVVALVVPANSDDGLIAYRTDFTRGTMPDHEYSLDELLEIAQETLEEGGLS